jgi:MFS family permease
VRRAGAPEHDQRRWIEPWYLAYGLLAAVQSGLIPILVPLVVGTSADATHVGVVMAALNLGGLSAPLWGHLADNRRLHRVILAAGLAATAIGLLAFAAVASLPARAGVVLLLGVCMAGPNTVANLFIIEARPSAEWDARIGWLQTFVGAGQTTGLLLAGPLGHLAAIWGLTASAVLAAAAVPIAWTTTATPIARIPRHHVDAHPPVSGDWAQAGPQRHFHHLTARELKQLGRVVRSPFGAFLAVWLTTFTAAAAVFALYPIAMRQEFGLAPVLSSTAFAAAAGLGLFLYAPASGWAQRFDAARVFRMGLMARAVAFAGIAVLGLAGAGRLLALPLVGIAVLAWSLLSVSSTTLAARSSPLGQGQSLGLYNAASSLAGVLGALAGGWITSHWSFGVLCGIAAVTVLLGLAVSLVAVRPIE